MSSDPMTGHGSWKATCRVVAAAVFVAQVAVQYAVGLISAPSAVAVAGTALGTAVITLLARGILNRRVWALPLVLLWEGTRSAPT